MTGGSLPDELLTIRPIDDAHPRPESHSVYDDWGERAGDAAGMHVDRWLIEITREGTAPIPVGDLSAHVVWYGPTTGSRAMNIGISLLPEYRGRGFGAEAQRLLAEELHRQGVVRVEASTDVDNIAEQRALAKAGFILEGVLRSAQGRADGLHDLQVWSHLVPSGAQRGLAPSTAPQIRPAS